MEIKNYMILVVNFLMAQAVMILQLRQFIIMLMCMAEEWNQKLH